MLLIPKIKIKWPIYSDSTVILNIYAKNNRTSGTSLVVQGLRLHIPNADPWSGNWIPHATTKDPTCCNGDPAQSNK